MIWPFSRSSDLSRVFKSLKKKINNYDKGIFWPYFPILCPWMARKKQLYLKLGVIKMPKRLNSSLDNNRVLVGIYDAKIFLSISIISRLFFFTLRSINVAKLLICADKWVWIRKRLLRFLIFFLSIITSRKVKIIFHS